ncbi:helix-turn-helix transcriptional regulator [Brevibacterium sp. FAM 25378]|uniref:helix-turn-helix transcriptional regulator n=1 Tax=unclassified Brevibacterium TaxID=2614124 RepID=UPI0023EF5076|nr:helix-turn-helix transcriptional regulator [Brevibacterium sp. S22]
MGPCLGEHGLTDRIAHTQSAGERRLEASAIIKKIRTSSGITRKELAQLANVSPSTIGRIERGEMDPTWATMQKILSASGRQTNGTSVVSSGDTSAIRAAAPLFTELFLCAEKASVRAATAAASAMEAVGDPWAERWKRAGWLNDSMGLDDLIAIAVSAGIAGTIARRPATRSSVAIEGGWRTLVDRLKTSEFDYAVTGFVATRRDRSEQTAGAPYVYVSDPRAAAEPIGLIRARAGQGILLLEAELDDLNQVEVEGGVRFVPKARALLDAFSGPGRDPDKAEDLLRTMWEQVFG